MVGRVTRKLWRATSKMDISAVMLLLKVGVLPESATDALSFERLWPVETAMATTRSSFRLHLLKHNIILDPTLWSALAATVNYDF